MKSADECKAVFEAAGVDLSKPVITTCGSSPCYRGASAANLLKEMGFDKVSYVEGGMAALLEAGIEIA